MRADRRRRGRAIRRARRLAAHGTVEVQISVNAAAFTDRLASAVDALVCAAGVSTFTTRVLFERLGLSYLAPPAGTRRQLLHQGRAPRGRR